MSSSARAATWAAQEHGSAYRGQAVRATAAMGPTLVLVMHHVAVDAHSMAIIEDELYYHAVTAKSLYKISVDLLTDASKTTDEVEAGVTFVCYSGMPDGMVLAGDAELKGTLYMTAVEKDGVDYLSTDGLDRVLPFVSDSLLQWPDSLAANSKYLYITASQVNAAPFILDARPRRNTYQLYRVKLPASSA